MGAGVWDEVGFRRTDYLVKWVVGAPVGWLGRFVAAGFFGRQFHEEIEAEAKGLRSGRSERSVRLIYRGYAAGLGLTGALPVGCVSRMVGGFDLAGLSPRGYSSQGFTPSGHASSSVVPLLACINFMLSLTAFSAS